MLACDIPAGNFRAVPLVSDRAVTQDALTLLGRTLFTGSSEIRSHPWRESIANR